jgi:hypothetical protein
MLQVLGSCELVIAVIRLDTTSCSKWVVVNTKWLCDGMGCKCNVMILEFHAFQIKSKKAHITSVHAHEQTCGTQPATLLHWPVPRRYTFNFFFFF